MTDLVLAPTVGVTVAPRARRRLRYAYGAAAVVALAGAILVAAVWSVGFDGPAPVRFVAGAEVVTLPSFGTDGSHVLQYRHGEAVAFSFPLENDGPVPISVTEVHLADEAFPMLAVERAAVGADELPVRLGPGESVSVAVTARFGNCRYYHEREIASFPAAIVGASVLGVDVTRTIAFDHPLVVHSPMIVGCPDRTLARDDDVRG